MKVLFWQSSRPTSRVQAWLLQTEAPSRSCYSSLLLAATAAVGHGVKYVNSSLCIVMRFVHLVEPTHTHRSHGLCANECVYECGGRRYECNSHRHEQTVSISKVRDSSFVRSSNSTLIRHIVYIDRTRTRPWPGLLHAGSITICRRVGPNPNPTRATGGSVSLLWSLTRKTLDSSRR